MRAPSGRLSVQQTGGGACSAPSKAFSHRLTHRRRGRWSMQGRADAEGGACTSTRWTVRRRRTCGRWSMLRAAWWKVDRADRDALARAPQGATRQSRQRILSFLLSLLLLGSRGESLALARSIWTGPHTRSRRMCPLTLRARFARCAAPPRWHRPSGRYAWVLSAKGKHIPTSPKHLRLCERSRLLLGETSKRPLRQQSRRALQRPKDRRCGAGGHARADVLDPMTVDGPLQASQQSSIDRARAKRSRQGNCADGSRGESQTWVTLSRPVVDAARFGPQMHEERDDGPQHASTPRTEQAHQQSTSAPCGDPYSGKQDLCRTARAGRAAGKQCARLANCANVDLPNGPIVQKRKSALALIFIWATVRLGNCRIAPLPDCLFVEFHTWAFRGFNSFVLYGILVFMIRFNVYFL